MYYCINGIKAFERPAACTVCFQETDTSNSLADALYSDLLDAQGRKGLVVLIVRLLLGTMYLKCMYSLSM